MGVNEIALDTCGAYHEKYLGDITAGDRFTWQSPSQFQNARTV
jgi:hypothetical protein